jgi:predicted nucleic acid-binding protein
MERAYFDTSVLAKRYFPEQGSAEAMGLVRRYQVLSSAITPLEAWSALCHRRAMGQLSERDFDDTVKVMRAEVEQWELIEINEPVLNRAQNVIETAGVKTLDAIHIAAALVVRDLSRVELRFVTADRAQSSAARRMTLNATLIALP